MVHILTKAMHTPIGPQMDLKIILNTLRAFGVLVDLFRHGQGSKCYALALSLPLSLSLSRSRHLYVYIYICTCTYIPTYMCIYIVQHMCICISYAAYPYAPISVSPSVTPESSGTSKVWPCPPSDFPACVREICWTRAALGLDAWATGHTRRSGPV